jgi:hypothetical protein
MARNLTVGIITAALLAFQAYSLVLNPFLAKRQSEFEANRAFTCLLLSQKQDISAFTGPTPIYAKGSWSWLGHPRSTAFVFSWKAVADPKQSYELYVFLQPAFIRVLRLMDQGDGKAVASPILLPSECGALRAS